jgi:phenylacetate-coenzyme A ligase PaaK-like adenylate-forming protein
MAPRHRVMKTNRQIISNWNFTPAYYQRSQEILDEALAKLAVYQTWRYLDPGPGHDIDSRFAALPALTKKDIREHFPQGMLTVEIDLNQGIATGEVSLVDSSGTTNDKITNIWNQKWWDASEMSSWKLNSYMSQFATGSHREAILVNPKNVGIKSDSIDLTMQQRSFSRFLYLNEKTDFSYWNRAYLERMIEELSLYQPSVLEANPSYLARLCRYAISTGKAIFQPDVIVFTYEYPAFFHYRQIHQVFPEVPTVSSYGTTETGYVFMQCEKGKLHQNSEYCRVDYQPFNKEQGGPLLGRILVTPLRNSWSYILRFDAGDIVHLDESGKCDCGRDVGLILSSINGRAANLTLTCKGRLVTLYELDNVLSALEGIEEYQLVQTNSGAYVFHLVSQSPDKEKLSREATMVLKKLYGQDALISLIYESEITPEISGKYLIAKALFPIEVEKYLD